jgi:hypothetical protein
MAETGGIHAIGHVWIRVDMGPRIGAVSGEGSATAAHHTAAASRLEGLRPATILLLSTWIGLVAGWLDLVMLVVKKRLIDGDFYRLGEHFVWLNPA